MTLTLPHPTLLQCPSMLQGLEAPCRLAERSCASENAEGTLALRSGSDTAGRRSRGVGVVVHGQPHTGHAHPTPSKLTGYQATGQEEQRMPTSTTLVACSSRWAAAPLAGNLSSQMGTWQQQPPHTQHSKAESTSYAAVSSPRDQPLPAVAAGDAALVPSVFDLFM